MTIFFECTNIKQWNLFKVSMLSIFKSLLVVILVLFFIEQSYANYTPINCEDMKKSTIVSSEKSSHVNTQMAHGHNTMLEENQSSHAECDTCNDVGCICPNIGGCFGSNTSASAHPIEENFIHFADNGHRFLTQNEHPDTGVYLHLFKPPIHI